MLRRLKPIDYCIDEDGTIYLNQHDVIRLIRDASTRAYGGASGSYVAASDIRALADKLERINK